MVTSRIWFTAQQKADLWERWRKGQSAAAISRALERRYKTGIERIVVLHGGIVPTPRRRAVAALRLEEREDSGESEAEWSMEDDFEADEADEFLGGRSGRFSAPKTRTSC